MSLRLTDPQPRYDAEIYSIDPTRPATRFAGPIGLDGRYKKGEPNYIQWLGIRDGDKLNLRVMLPEGNEISIDGEMGG